MESLIEEAITDYWGERCDDYHERCVCCAAWKEYDLLRDGARALAKGAMKEIAKWKLEKENDND